MNKKLFHSLLIVGFVAHISAAQAVQEFSITTTSTVTPYINIGLESGYQPQGFDRLSIQSLTTSTLPTTGSFAVASLTFDVGYNATRLANYLYSANPKQVFEIGYTDSFGDSGTLALPYDIDIGYSDTLTIHPSTIALTNAGYTLTTADLKFGPQGNGSVTQNLQASLTSIAAPVPEPETYAMMMAGLGMLGFIGRRKKQQDTVS